MHDHPVSFLSLILRGWYKEDRGRFGGVWNQGWQLSKLRRFWNWISASSHDLHTITDCDPKTLTLCFMGPVRRTWGYHTPDGWVGWKQYNKEKYG